MHAQASDALFRRSFSRGLGLLLIGFLAPFLCGCSLRAEPFSGPTTVRIFLPFSSSGLRSGIDVSDKISGNCFTRSLASAARPDAWRCMAGNRILDPCFEGFGQQVLACAEQPWVSRVVMLTPAKDLPRDEAPSGFDPEGFPWALELANGLRCAFLTGATTGFAGLRVNYGCQGGEGFVLGKVDRSHSQWQVFLSSPENHVAERIGVVVAWY